MDKAMARKPMFLLKSLLLVLLTAVTLNTYAHGCFVYLGSRCGCAKYVYKKIWVPSYRYHCCNYRAHYTRVAVPIYRGPYNCCYYKGPCGCFVADQPCHWNTYGKFNEGGWLVFRR